MIEYYIYLLAKSYFWVMTIFQILLILASFTDDNKASYEIRKKKRKEKGTLGTVSIKAIIMWTLYWLAILIYFKI